MKLKLHVLFLAFTMMCINTLMLQASDKYEWYKVLEIIDGDTIRISYKGKSEKVRFFGIDAPERGEAGYFQAAAVVEELCYGEYVRLEFQERRKRDVYKRLLAKVYLRDNRMINMELYKRGVVKLYKKSPLLKAH